MVSLFKDRSAAIIIWLLLLTVAVHSHFFVMPPVIVASQNDGLISEWLIKYLDGGNSTFHIFLYLFIILLQATRLNYLFTSQRMFSQANYLTAMVFILLTGIFESWSNLSPALIANTMVIILYGLVVKLYGSPNPKTLLFNIGLVIGVSILLYHPLFLLIFIALFALMVVRPFKINESFVLLMGILLPYYFLFSYLFYTGQLKNSKQYLPNLRFNMPAFSNSTLSFVTMGVVVLILLMGIIAWQEHSRRMLIHIRKNWGVLIVMLLLILPLPFINKNASLNSLMLWIVPMSPFMAKGFLTAKKNTIPNIMFWALLLLGILNTWLIFKK